jgi:hypothetical protein
MRRLVACDTIVSEDIIASIIQFEELAGQLSYCFFPLHEVEAVLCSGLHTVNLTRQSSSCIGEFAQFRTKKTNVQT